MKLINKPSKIDIEYFGYITAYIMDNAILITILLLIFGVIVFLVAISYILEVSIKSMVMKIWEGTN